MYVADEYRLFSRRARSWLRHSAADGMKHGSTSYPSCDASPMYSRGGQDRCGTAAGLADGVMRGRRWEKEST